MINKLKRIWESGLNFKKMLITKNDRTIEYHEGFYSVARDGEHWIRLTDGCFRQCWNCYTPAEKRVYDLPEIQANKVRFLDQNFLWAHPEPLKLLQSLPKKFKNKVIRYMFYSGLDFTLFTPEIVRAMKKARVGRFNNEGNFINGLSIAWDRGYNEAEAIGKAIDMMLEAGYSRRGIQVRMLCNGKIPYSECMQKLRYLYDKRMMIDDCWFDNQRRGSVNPIHWTDQECKDFGQCCRANNIAVMQNQHDPFDRLYHNKGLKMWRIRRCIYCKRNGGCFPDKAPSDDMLCPKCKHFRLSIIKLLHG